MVRRADNNRSLYQWLRRRKEFVQKYVFSMTEDEVQRFNELKTIGFE